MYNYFISVFGKNIIAIYIQYNNYYTYIFTFLTAISLFMQILFNIIIVKFLLIIQFDYSFSIITYRY